MDETTEERREGDVSVVIPAAGQADRMGGGVRKPFLELDGEPLLFRACRALRDIAGVFEIVVALHPGDLDRFLDEQWEKASSCGITLAVAGGASRAESVWRALEVVSARAEIVAVHDAVRPFVAPDVVNALVSTARRRGAAVPVTPMVDTPKRIEGDVVVETPRRLGLVRAQTPQVFRTDLLIEAYEYAMRTGGLSDRITDDSQMVSDIGHEVAAVYGSEFNLKITTPFDFKLAHALLNAGLVR